jgi:hypothetical protein
MSSCNGFPDYQVPQDANGGGRFVINDQDRTFHWNQMINFSLNIFLPTEPRRSE